MCLLASCEKPAPIARDVPKVPSAPETNLILAASQLALAKSHLTAEAPEKAIPYLEAAITNGSPTEAKILLAESLASARFTVPVTRFSHPYPVTTFVRSDTSLFAAIAGPHPTVVRWDLEKKPRAAAVLFPTGKQTIRHLALSPSGKHLLVHRGDTNLLCLAETLKPVTNLGTFPAYIDSNHLQPFSGNSLLLAHPTSNERTFTFHIRDSATGETLRSESFPLFPKPTRATFQDTTLFIELEDHTRIEIPIIGETIRTGSQERNAEFSPQPQTEFTNVTGNLLRHTSIPPSLIPSFPPSLYPAITGYRLNLTTQSLAKVPTPERLATLSETFPEIPPTFTIHTCETAVHTRLAAAFPEEFPELTAPARAHAKIIEEIFATGDPAAIAAIIRSVPPSGLPTATALFLSLKSKKPSLHPRDPSHRRKRPARPKEQGHSCPTKLPQRTGLARLRIPGLLRNLHPRAKRKPPTSSPNSNSPPPPPKKTSKPSSPTYSPGNPSPPAPRDPRPLRHHRRPLPFQNRSPSHLLPPAHRPRPKARHPQPEILRTQATALGTLAQFLPAHRAWISLITQQPEATHLPSDYSEAAHSAFENADPDQAAEILRIGLFRFPNDVVLAIRAGWIALLTEQPEQAADYLTRATRIGLPRDEVENTTALLAIAHTQRGDPDTAYAFLQQLTAINEKWADPATIEKLPWPEPLKASLRQLTWE